MSTTHTNAVKGSTSHPLPTWHRKQKNRNERIARGGGHVPAFLIRCRDARQVRALPRPACLVSGSNADVYASGDRRK
jgi:hypothetical protein